VHKDELVFLKEPEIFMPDKQKGKGRPSKKLKAKGGQINLYQYAIACKKLIGEK